MRTHIWTFAIILFLLIATLAMAMYAFYLNSKISTFEDKIETQTTKIEDLKISRDEDKKEISELEEESSRLHSINQELEKEMDEIMSDNQGLNKEMNESVGESKTNAAENTKDYSNSTHFTIGSPKEEVNSVMGAPDSVINNSWWYGTQSYIRFDSDDLVSSYYDGGEILKTE